MAIFEDDRTSAIRPDRQSLIAYLQYALAELAAVNETSAALVRMAIFSLEEEVAIVPPDEIIQTRQ